MTDTPETDAMECYDAMCDPDRVVEAGFARKLERERDDAIQARKQSAAEWLEITRLADIRTTRAKRERDEAREQCDKLAEALIELRDAEWLNMPGRANYIVEAALAAWKEARSES